MTPHENILCCTSSTGASAFDARTAYMQDEMHADETLTDLITAGKIPPLIAVGVNERNHNYGKTR